VCAAYVEKPQGKMSAPGAFLHRLHYARSWIVSLYLTNHPSGLAVFSAGFSDRITSADIEQKKRPIYRFIVLLKETIILFL
jgi:hypothetical protein